MMKIMKLLGVTPEKLEKAAQERLAGDLKRGQESLISKTEATRDSLAREKGKLLHVKTSMSEQEILDWNNKFQNLELRVLENQVDLTVAESTLKEYFTEGKTETKS